MSLYSALLMMPPEWRADLYEGFDWSNIIQWDDACVELVARAQEVNTYSSLSTPVPVWLDPDGNFIVNVYDGPEVEP